MWLLTPSWAASPLARLASERNDGIMKAHIPISRPGVASVLPQELDTRRSGQSEHIPNSDLPVIEISLIRSNLARRRPL